MENLIQKHNDLQKDILGHYAIKRDSENATLTFREEIKNRYGFETMFGWNIMLNSYYVLDDTELSKISFYKFGFQGPSRHKDIGEKYLRLYGILNAIYQQKQAIENLLEIHKIPNKKKLLDSLSSSRILELRNKIGSHPSNFMSNDISENKFDVYEISRPDLDLDNVVLLKNQSIFEEFDIYSELKVFDKNLIDLLHLTIGKIIKQLFNNQGKFHDRYSALTRLKNGEIDFNGIMKKFKG